MRTVSEQKSVQVTGMTDDPIPAAILVPTLVSHQVIRVRAICRSATGAGGLCSRTGATAALNRAFLEFEEVVFEADNPVAIQTATFDGDWDFVAEIG